MRILAAFLTTTVLALLPVALPGPAQADDAKVCYSGDSAPDAAIRACTRMIESKKFAGQQRANALSWRMQAFLKKGDEDAALADADSVIRAAPAGSAGFEQRAQIWLRKNDFERAKRDTDDAVRLAPNIATTYNTRGFIRHLAKEYDQAIADFDRAIRLDPKVAAFFSNRGNSWQGKTDYPRALADHNEAVRLGPKEAGLYSNRGGVYREMGDFDRAFADFDQVLRLNPKFPTAYAGRGLIWRAKGDYERAVAEFDRAIDLDPRFTAAYVGRGLARESKGDIDRARQDFKAALLERATGQVQGLPVGRMYIWGDRYKDIARARLQVLEAAAAPVPSPVPVSEENPRRIALVIGNGAYANSVRLANPANDAAIVAKNLRGIGFDVTEGLDLDVQRMNAVINGFLRAASTSRMALLFYAGHGLQIGGKNYLVPIDAKLDTPEGMASDLSDVDTILAGLDDQIRTNIVILDACRDNPAVSNAANASASRSLAVRSGLAAPSGLGAGATVGAGTLLAFATAPGQIALDGEGGNSPFSAALARHISTPGLELQQMLTRVRAEVVAATKSRQVPWSNSSLLGDVFLVSAR